MKFMSGSGQTPSRSLSGKGVQALGQCDRGAAVLQDSGTSLLERGGTGDGQRRSRIRAAVQDCGRHVTGTTRTSANQRGEAQTPSVWGPPGDDAKAWRTWM
jgi:hypothetical protein